MNRQRGFTLVEIAIVLVIIGLLLGGILKGQELVTNARVRNIADQQNSIKAAVYAFQDRFRALPGDYLSGEAKVNIPGATTPVGNGNARIDTDGERSQAWFQLASSGFIACSQCAKEVATAPDATNSPVNAYNGVMVLTFDNNYYEGAVATGSARNNLKTGDQIPPNIMAEVDRKLDDGSAGSGNVRFSIFSVGTTKPAAADCVTVAAPTTTWKGAETGTNCGGASFL